MDKTGKFRKRLGQHMVVDKPLIRRIVNYASLTSEDVVLEVGCGTGNLTVEMLKICRVTGIEKDERMVELLRKKFSGFIESGKFTILQGDALKMEFPPFTKFVSNIPYNITSPLLFKLFGYDFELAVVMLQREVAERLCGESSRLGVVSKIFCRTEILEIVKPSSFKPRPKVYSAVVRIIPEPSVRVGNPELFCKFVTFAFSMKRKKMRKIVEEWNKREEEELSLSPEMAGMRPEELGAKSFAKIVDRNL